MPGYGTERALTARAWNSATNENTEGALQSFFVKQDGSLTPALGHTSSGGNGPAFAVPLSTGEVAVMNVSPVLTLISPLSRARPRLSRELTCELDCETAAAGVFRRMY